MMMEAQKRLFGNMNIIGKSGAFLKIHLHVKGSGGSPTPPNPKELSCIKGK